MIITLPCNESVGYQVIDRKTIGLIPNPLLRMYHKYSSVMHADILLVS